MEGVGRGHVDVRPLDADPHVGHLAGGDELLGGRVGDVDRGGEPETLGPVVGGHRRGQADHRPAGIEEGAAGRTGRDGSVGLDHVEERGTGTGVETAVESAHDADGHRGAAGQPEGRADGNGGLAHLQLRGRAHAGHGEGAAVDLHDGDIGLGVGAEHLGRQLATVVEDDLDRVGPVDDVEVGQHVPVASDQDSGAAGIALLALDPDLGDRRAGPLGDLDDGLTAGRRNRPGRDLLTLDDALGVLVGQSAGGGNDAGREKGTDHPGDARHQSGAVAPLSRAAQL